MTGRRVLFGLAFAGVCVALFWPSVDVVVPGPRLPWDKAVHLAMFAVLALLGGWAQLPLGWLLAVLLGLAVVSEVVQGALLPGRTGDLGDLAVDVTGVVVGAGLWWLFGGRRRRVPG